MNREQLKILYISHSSGVNGAEMCLLTLLKHLDKRRFIPIAVLPSDGTLKNKLESFGIKTYVFPLAWWIPSVRNSENRNAAKIDIVERCNGLASFIQQQGIDIVHTNTSVVVEGAIAAKMTGRPHIWHLHEILKAYPSLKPSLPLYLTYKFIELHSDIVIAVTYAVKNCVSEAASPEHIKVIHNGIDVIETPQSEANFRTEIGVSKDDILVCTIGSVIREKGIDTFIEAAKQALRYNKNIRFIIVGSVGDVEQVSILLKDVRRSSLTKYIKFLGYRNDVARILNQIDICVVPSQTESFGLVQLEAMAAAKPIIATRCGGPEEIVIEGETGILVPVNDSGAMAQAIISLSENSEYRRRLGLNGLSRYARYFTAANYCNQIEALYPKLSSKRALDSEQQKFADSLVELVISVVRANNASPSFKNSRWDLRRLTKLAYYQAAKAISGQIPY